MVVSLRRRPRPFSELMDKAPRGGGVVVQKNAVEDVEFAEGRVEEELTVALAHAPVAEDEAAVAAAAPDRVRVVGVEAHEVAGQNDGVLGG